MSTTADEVIAFPVPVEPIQPVPQRLDPLLFKDLHIALLQQRIAQLQGQAALATVEQGVAAALAAAGLDPQARYHLDSQTFTVTRLPS